MCEACWSGGIVRSLEGALVLGSWGWGCGSLAETVERTRWWVGVGARCHPLHGMYVRRGWCCGGGSVGVARVGSRCGCRDSAGWC